MLNLLTGETKSHSPDFMATVRIPHTYPLNSHVSASRDNTLWQYFMRSECQRLFKTSMCITGVRAIEGAFHSFESDELEEPKRENTSYIPPNAVTALTNNRKSRK